MIVCMFAKYLSLIWIIPNKKESKVLKIDVNKLQSFLSPAKLFSSYLNVMRVHGSTFQAPRKVNS